MTNTISIRWLLILTAMFFTCAAVTPVHADVKLEAQLIWGTTDEKSPDPTHKPVDPEVAAKLKSLHLQWKSFFVINRKQFSVAKDDTKTEKLSSECEIKVKNLGHSQMELTIYGKGKEIGTIKQSLPKGELLVTGGNAENSTAWFVALKQVE